MNPGLSGQISAFSFYTAQVFRISPVECWQSRSPGAFPAFAGITGTNRPEAGACPTDSFVESFVEVAEIRQRNSTKFSTKGQKSCSWDKLQPEDASPRIPIRSDEMSEHNFADYQSNEARLASRRR